MLYIKNMVCDRCKTMVKSDLDAAEVPYASVELGRVTLNGEITSQQRKQLAEALHKNGFVLIEEEKNLIIEKLRAAIANLEKYADEDLKISFTDFLSLSLKDNFISLNTLFSEIEGLTIEKYIIRHKIEKIKELLVYENFTLTEIANRLHYSSVAQLSNQFKRSTGLTPTHFKLLRQTRFTNQQIN